MLFGGRLRSWLQLAATHQVLPACCAHSSRATRSKRALEKEPAPPPAPPKRCVLHALRRFRRGERPCMRALGVPPHAQLRPLCHAAACPLDASQRRHARPRPPTPAHARSAHRHLLALSLTTRGRLCVHVAIRSRASASRKRKSSTPMSDQPNDSNALSGSRASAPPSHAGSSSATHHASNAGGSGGSSPGSSGEDGPRRASASGLSGLDEAEQEALDQLEASAASAQSWGAPSNALHGLLRKLGAGLDDLLPSMSASHSRLKGILSGLRADDDGSQIAALSELCELLSIGAPPCPTRTRTRGGAPIGRRAPPRAHASRYGEIRREKRLPRVRSPVPSPGYVRRH